jgi:hypothetical protein
MYQPQPNPEPPKCDPPAGLYLEGMAVSVGYGDFLDTTLHHNLGHFDNFVVVTSYHDRHTQAVCARHGVTCVQTDHHRDDGAAFNKGLLINLGIAHLRHRGWIMHLDADVALPDRVRWILAKSRLDPDCIYGADRLEVVGRQTWDRLQAHPSFARQYSYKYLVSGPALPLGARLLHNEYGYCPIGYFQMWHAKHRQRRYHDSQGSAEHSDVLFSLQWPAAKRQLLPGMLVYHLQSEPARMGANWQGRTTKGW